MIGAAGTPLFLLIVWITSALGHICVLNPPQRTTKPTVQVVGSLPAFCGNVRFPCASPDPSLTAVHATPISVQNPFYNVSIYKPSNYYTTDQPGFFTFTYRSIGNPQMFPGTLTLASVPDNNFPSVHPFTVTVRLPQVNDVGVLGVEYHAQSVGTVFYQCSDIQLIKSM